MILGKIVFDHRPPLALRAKGDDANDPDRLVAICTVCDQRKTPRDIKDISRAKRLALNQQDFVERMRDKIPGRPVPSKRQWRKVKEKMQGAEPSVGSSGRHDEGRQLQMGAVDRKQG
jgi:hypothetical protein